MLSALIATVLAAAAPAASTAEAASARYGDCLLSHLQAGMSDQTAQLVQQACAAKHPQGRADAALLEMEAGKRRQAEFQRINADAVKSANEAAAAAARQANQDAAATSEGVSRGR